MSLSNKSIDQIYIPNKPSSIDLSRKKQPTHLHQQSLATQQGEKYQNKYNIWILRMEKETMMTQFFIYEPWLFAYQASENEKIGNIISFSSSLCCAKR